MALIFLFSATRGWSALSFDPDLGETMDWLAGKAASPDAPPIQPPANAPDLTRHPLTAETPRELLSQIPGRPFHDLSSPPRTAAWWKYPIYAVVGFPRDAMDSVFGFVGFWPIFNVGFVGVGYELVPTQVLLRDPRDWHHWPGRRNKNGHGWIDSDGWGWFPTLHQMKFTYESKRKLARYQAENEKLTAELQELNRQIEIANHALADRQKAARTSAVEAIDKGDGAEAVAWALPLHLAYPENETAHAILLNALALDGDAGPEWVRPCLWGHLSKSGLRVLKQAETLLAKTQKDFPKSNTTTEALVFIQTRLGEVDKAQETARTWFQAASTDPRRARLYLETALAARDGKRAADAFGALESAAPKSEDLAALRFRLALLNGKAPDIRPALVELLAKNPENAYYRYYMGCVELAAVESADDPEDTIHSAVTELERASLNAETTPLLERAGKALGYARALTSKETELTAQPKTKAMIEVGPQKGFGSAPKTKSPSGSKGKGKKGP